MTATIIFTHWHSEFGTNNETLSILYRPNPSLRFSHHCSLLSSSSAASNHPSDLANNRNTAEHNKQPLSFLQYTNLSTPQHRSPFNQFIRILPPFCLLFSSFREVTTQTSRKIFTRQHPELDPSKFLINNPPVLFPACKHLALPKCRTHSH